MQLTPERRPPTFEPLLLDANYPDPLAPELLAQPTVSLRQHTFVASCVMKQLTQQVAKSFNCETMLLLHRCRRQSPVSIRHSPFASNPSQKRDAGRAPLAHNDAQCGVRNTQWPAVLVSTSPIVQQSGSPRFEFRGPRSSCLSFAHTHMWRGIARDVRGGG